MKRLFAILLFGALPACFGQPKQTSVVVTNTVAVARPQEPVVVP